MKSQTNKNSARKAGFWGAALTISLGLLGWVVSELKVEDAGLDVKGLSNLSYDTLFLLRPSLLDTNVVIVSMDEESHQQLGQSPDQLWNRALHAELVEILLAHGARTVVFDVLFLDSWPDPAVDARLAEALKRGSGKVILAASLPTFELSGQGGGSPRTLEPIELLAANAPFGIVELPKDSDGVLRRHHLTDAQRHLSWKSAELLGASLPSSQRERWINYYSPREGIRHVSYWQALRPENLAPDVFSNRVVFVGKSRIISPRGANPGDEYPTPHTRWTGYLMSGVEIQATVFLNLLRGDWLTRIPAAAELALLIAAGAIFGFGLTLARPLPAFGLAFGGALLVAAGTFILFLTQRLWFPWLIVAALQVPFALLWAVLSYVQRVSQTNEIPDHTLLRRVGRGAYGEVWLAADVIGGFHAVKIVHRKNFPNSEPFEREFRGMQKFAPLSRSHPGLVHILHVGRNELQGCFYYIMEAADDAVGRGKIDPADYIPKTLSREIAARGRLRVQESVSLALDLSSALDHLHQRGLIHRDIKPANIIFVEGRPKLADIGLVTLLGAPAATQIGTSGYLAPEGPGTASADVFALGKTLYEAATGCECGQFPELPTGLTAGHEADALVQLHEILLNACETNPADRYSTAAAMHADLLKLQASLQEATLRRS